ncbi:transposase [Kineococcus endophyticus]
MRSAPTSTTGCWRGARRAERALTIVVPTAHLLGVSTSRMEKLVETLGITRFSKLQVSEMANDLASQVEASRTRPLPAAVTPSPPPARWCQDSRGRPPRHVVANVHALSAVGVKADGHRYILGLLVSSAEHGTGWLGFFRDLTARGLSGVRLVTSDAQAGLVAAIGATLLGASWQRCRTHYAANLVAVTPKTSCRSMKSLLHSVCDQPDAASLRTQFDRPLDPAQAKLPSVTAHLDPAGADVQAFTSS